MGKILIATLLTASLSSVFASHQFFARIDVYGSAKKIELQAVPDGKMSNIDWGDKSTRKYSITGTSAALSQGEWTKISFSFIPQNTGCVLIDLMSAWKKTKGKKHIDEVWIYFDAISAEGTEIKNGDFSVRDNGFPTNWNCAKSQYTTEGLEFYSGDAAVKVWHNKRCSQTIKVTGEQKVTISAYVRPAEYIESKE